mmetsp:Transcript_22571/g.22404  ORF Transcript_22571/g.22404 Transcript_22571/m.22404 type:complete len:128 (-) Transcript_22571:903-1286(-)
MDFATYDKTSDKQDQYDEDYEQDSHYSKSQNESETLFPSVKKTMGTKQLASSYNEDMGSLEVINNRMKEELQSLLTNLESHLEKAKENKRRYLEAKMQTDGLYNKDEDLYSAQNNINKLEKDIKRMK